MRFNRKEYKQLRSEYPHIPKEAFDLVFDTLFSLPPNRNPDKKFVEKINRLGRWLKSKKRQKAN